MTMCLVHPTIIRLTNHSQLPFQHTHLPTLALRAHLPHLSPLIDQNKTKKANSTRFERASLALESVKLPDPLI
jgi:hypothetical protein